MGAASQLAQRSRCSRRIRSEATTSQLERPSRVLGGGRMQQTDVCRGFFSFFSQTLPSTSLHFTPSFLTFYLRTVFCLFLRSHLNGGRSREQSKRAPPSPLALPLLRSLSLFVRTRLRRRHSHPHLAFESRILEARRRVFLQCRRRVQKSIFARAFPHEKCCMPTGCMNQLSVGMRE